MSQVKMFVSIPMRQDVTRQFFHDHWRHPHGSWGLRIPTIVRYVQSHRIDTPLLGPGQALTEGVVEVWLENEADALGLRTQQEYVDFLKDDEPNFIDMAGLKGVFAEEQVIQHGRGPDPVDGSADWAWRAEERPISIKFIQLVEEEGGLPWTANDDEELGHAVGALRHVRSVPNRAVHPEAAPAPFIGVRELWWPTISDFEAGCEAAPTAWRQLLAKGGRGIAGLFQAERFR